MRPGAGRAGRVGARVLTVRSLTAGFTLLIAVSIGVAAAGVVFVEVMLKRVPTSAYTHHHMGPQHPDEDECTGVAYFVLSLRDFGHGELGGARALAEDLPYQLVQVAHVTQDSLLLFPAVDELRLRVAVPLLPIKRPAARLVGVLLRVLLRVLLQVLQVADLLLDLLLELHQHGGGHAELGPSARHLQQAQHNVLLVAALHQVVGLEHEHVFDAQLVPAPADEVGDVVARYERSGNHAARLERHVPPGSEERRVRVLGQELERGAVHVVAVATESAARLQALHEGVGRDVQVVQAVQPLGQVLLHGVEVLLAGLKRTDAFRSGALDVALVGHVVSDRRER